MNVLKIQPYLHPVLMAHLLMRQELLLVMLALQDHSVLMGLILSHVLLAFTALKELVMICNLAPVALLTQIMV